MVEIITYSLRENQKHSDQYYQEIAVFTDEVLAKIKRQARPILENYQRFLQENQKESGRSLEEYAFELLTLGVFWQTYIHSATRLSSLPQHALSALAKLRKRYRRLKFIFDFWRGILGTTFLVSRNGYVNAAPAFSLQNLHQLIEWMTATGELNQETKRLKLWWDFLRSVSLAEAEESIKAAINLSTWFETRSLETLGSYTENVDIFLDEKHSAYRWREDVVMCGRKRIEYHLNMVGIEILNRAFRNEFLETGQKIVLLPPCMCAQPLDECKAQSTPYGDRCMACTPGCRVHQTTKLGDKYGFGVFIMPHELSVFSNGNIKPSSDKSVGIVGVSCPLTNVSGGWETKDLGVPAQGVLLDYCGCPWHWHDEGIPTDINLNQLLKVLAVQENSSRRRLHK
jgi:hypothetical protein